MIISIKTHTIICFASEEDVSVQPLTSSGTHCSCWMMCPVDTLASFNHTPRSRGPGEAGRHQQPLWSHPSQFPSHSHHCSRPMSPAGRRLFFRWCTPTSRSACLKQTHPLSLFWTLLHLSAWHYQPPSHARQTLVQLPHTPQSDKPRVPRPPRGSTFSPSATTAGSRCTTRSHMAWPSLPGPHPAAPPIHSLYHWQGSFLTLESDHSTSTPKSPRSLMLLLEKDPHFRRVPLRQPLPRCNVHARAPPVNCILCHAGLCRGHTP